MFDKDKQQPRLPNLKKPLPVIVHEVERDESNKTLYKEDSDSSRLSINPEQLAHRKQSFMNWQSTEPNYQELSSLRKYIRKGEQINHQNVKNLTKIIDRDQKSTFSLLNPNHKYSKEGYAFALDRNSSIERIQESIQETYLKQQVSRVPLPEQKKPTKNKKNITANRTVGKAGHRRIPSTRLSKTFKSQEVQTQKPVVNSVKSRNMKSKDKEKKGGDLSKQKKPFTIEESYLTLQESDRNSRLKKFINLSSILEKDEEQPQPHKKKNNIRNNHMATKYLLNQSSYAVQPSTAPSLMSSTYLDTMSKLSSNFNSEVEKLKMLNVNNRQRYDFTVGESVENMESQGFSGQNLNTRNQSGDGPVTGNRVQDQNMTFDQFESVKNNKNQARFGIKNYQTEEIKGFKAQQNESITQADERKSMSIIAEQSQNADSRNQLLNDDVGQRKKESFAVGEHYNSRLYRDFGTERMDKSQQLQDGFMFGTINNFVKRNDEAFDNHSKIDSMMQFPEISEIRVSPVVNKAQVTSQSYKIHPIRSNFSQSNGMNWMYENYKPKSQILQNFSFQTFSIKKYKNGVYFGEFQNQKSSPKQQNLDETPKEKEQEEQESSVESPMVKQGRGIIFYFNGKLYEGEFYADMKSGKGYQEFPDGSKYKGQFFNGFKNGKGIFEWPNGQIYEGEFRNGKKHGSGMWKGVQGESYIGEWNQGLVHGFGVFISKNGDRYEGEFKNSQKHGLGTERFSNGETYVGEYKKNRPNGKGEYFYANGDYYKGDFMNHLRHGQGYFKSQSLNQIYEGQFMNDKKCGFGELQQIETGQIYRGNFENDLRHGYGETLNRYGSDQEQLTKGFWVNDKPLEQDQDQKFSQNHHPEEKQMQNPQKKNQRVNPRVKASKAAGSDLKIKAGKEPSSQKANMNRTNRLIQKSKSPQLSPIKSLQRSLEKSQQSEGKRACGCARRH